MVLKAGMTKSEIEKEISGKGQYIQIDWLNRYLREPLTMEMKKFIYQKLADIYEKSGMFKESGKMYDNMATLAITFVEKIKHYMKSVEMFVRGGDTFGAEEAMKKASGNANSREREDIYRQTIQFYKTYAADFETKAKRANAVQLYEKLLEMRLTSSERAEVKEKLQVLYERLGKLKELRNLDRKTGDQPVNISPRSRPETFSKRPNYNSYSGQISTRQESQAKQAEKPKEKTEFELDDLWR